MWQILVSVPSITSQSRLAIVGLESLMTVCPSLHTGCLIHQKQHIFIPLCFETLACIRCNSAIVICMLYIFLSVQSSHLKFYQSCNFCWFLSTYTYLLSNWELKKWIQIGTFYTALHNFTETKKLCKPLPQTSPIITSINRWLFGTDIKKLLPYLLIWLPVAVVSNAISLHGNQFQFRKNYLPFLWSEQNTILVSMR